MGSFPKFIVLVLLCNLVPPSCAVLKVGFYVPTCPRAETIVRQLVRARFASDKSITAALLRMHFHDCFVRGCDASILLDSTPTRVSEKEAGPNLTVRGYELIDKIKAALEAACPNAVSCADIVTLATRDAVALAGGPAYAVPTGRRDGLVSDAGEVDLPGPDFTVAEARRAFAVRGLTVSDMVILLGAHTVGVSHCSFFSDRLENFHGTGVSDPTMSSVLAKKLTTICKNGDPTVFLDQNTSFVFDNEFYRQLQFKNGILAIDQELAIDPSSSRVVLAMARNGTGFKQSFGSAMIKMGGIQVLVGNKGQIRKNCRVVNPKSIISPPPPKPISFPSPPPSKPINTPPKQNGSPPPPKPITTPPKPTIGSPPPPKPITTPKQISPPKQSISPPSPIKL